MPVCITAKHVQQIKSKNKPRSRWGMDSSYEAEDWWTKSDKCMSVLEHCQEAAESSLLVGWSGIIVSHLTLIAQLPASSLPGRTSVKASFKETKNLCKYCTIAWDKMVIQGTKLLDVLNLYFHRTRSYIGSAHGSSTTARRMLLKEENKPNCYSVLCSTGCWILPLRGYTKHLISLYFYT